MSKYSQKSQINVPVAVPVNWPLLSIGPDISLLSVVTPLEIFHTCLSDDHILLLYYVMISGREQTDVLHF